MAQYTGVNDSGDRQNFDTGSVRDTREGKGRFDLIPHYPLKRLAQHYENGAKKYGDRNWEKGQPLMRFIDSAERHLNNIKSGDRSEDHESAVLWNIMGFMDTLNRIKSGDLPDELDDRPNWMRSVEELAEPPKELMDKIFEQTQDIEKETVSLRIGFDNSNPIKIYLVEVVRRRGGRVCGVDQLYINATSNGVSSKKEIEISPEILSLPELYLVHSRTDGVYLVCGNDKTYAEDSAYGLKSYFSNSELIKLEGIN